MLSPHAWYNYGLTMNEAEIVTNWPQKDQDLFFKWAEGRSGLFVFKNFNALKILSPNQLEWIFKHSIGNSYEYSVLLLRLVNIYTNDLPSRIAIYDDLNTYFKVELLAGRLQINCAMLLIAVPKGEQCWLIRTYNKLSSDDFAMFIVEYLTQDKDYRSVKILIDNAFDGWIDSIGVGDTKIETIKQWKNQVLTYIHLDKE